MANFTAGSTAIDMTSSLKFNIIFDEIYTNFNGNISVLTVNGGQYYLYTTFNSNLTALTSATLYIPGSVPLGTFPTAGVIWSATGFSLPVEQIVPYVNLSTFDVNVTGLLTVALAGNDNLTGSPLNDKLIGYAGNDTIDGGAGADTMLGITGNDTYIVDNAGDIVAELPGQGTDSVISSFNYSLATLSAAGVGSLENLTLTGSANLNGIGNELNNSLTGNTGNNILIGGLGSDTLDGGNAGPTGSGAADGNDTLIGGAGNDTYYVMTGDAVVEGTGGGTDLVVALGDFTLPSNLDNLTLGGTNDTTGIGNELANLIKGNIGNNTIDGGVGNDTLEGGTGNDTYIVDSSGDKVNDVAGVIGGIDVIQASVSYSIALSPTIENIVLTGTGNINATGNALANVLTGNEGNNVLNGGLGNDTMSGGLGNDSYTVNALGDQVTEAFDEGIDTVTATLLAGQTYVLGADVENLVLGGLLSTHGTGNALDNALTGNAAANTLNGGAGNDTLDGKVGADALIGGAGADVYSVDALGDVVTETGGDGAIDEVRSTVSFDLSLAGRGEIENVTLLGTAAIATGNGLGNVLTGNASANTLDGGAGNDTLIGGAGNDIYVVNNGDDVIQETIAVAGGVDTVRSAVSFDLASDGVNVENVVLLAGAGNIDATGSDAKNVLTGNEGDNVLNGGLGNDTMVGGLGNDTYVVNAAGDVVTEGLNAGTGDTVQASITYVLGANLENLALIGTGNINATGNALANVLTGNEGNNVLNGGLGNDTMSGGLGNDSYTVNALGDQVTEAFDEGIDTVTATLLAGQTYVLGADVENLVLGGLLSTHGTGNALDNALTGNAAANTLNGGAGNDTLKGGAGNDTLIGGADFDIADYSTSTAAVVVNLTTNSATGSLIGTDTLTDIEGVRGGAGNDTFTDGAGGNVFYVGAGDKILTDIGGTDEVFSSATFSLLANGVGMENLTLLGTSNINATGNDKDNILTGNSGDNLLVGGLGNDTLDGAGGNDVADYSASIAAVVVDLSSNTASGSEIGTDTLMNLEGVRGGAGNDTLTGDGDDIVDYSASPGAVTVNLGSNTATGNGSDILSGFLVVKGSAFGDTLTGGSGNDTLDGGAGNDVFSGDAGDDTYIVGATGDDVVDDSGGTDTVLSSVTFTLDSFLENLTLTGSGAINGTGNDVANVLTGNAGANVLTGKAGNDTLNGMAGADTMLGGADNDTYVVDSIGDIVNETATGSGGTDSVQASITHVLGTNLENLTLTGTANINATGNGLNNVLDGNSGNNVLNGGLGNDTMAGGAGNDTYVVNVAADQAIEDPGAGTDLVQSAATWLLGDNFENLTLTGTASVNGTGNAQANVIIGNTGNNVLDGGADNDTLTGGAGNDSYVVDSAADKVTELAAAGTDSVQSSLDWVLGANLENLTLTGGAGLSGTGNTLNNVITGTAFDDTLTGLAGNDTLDGGAGNDTLIGGAGNDVLVIDNPDDVIVEVSAGGTDLVRSSITYELTDANLENLELTGGDDSGTGNAGANRITGSAGNNLLYGLGGNDTLTGGAGNDTLDGGGGIDTMTGGTGDDVYYVSVAGDVVVELAAQGNDTLNTPFATTLAATLENLTLTGTGNVNGTGNASANVLTGNDGHNQLFGLAGNDTLSGGLGNDRLDGGTGNDTLTGGDGNDTYVFDSLGDQAIELASEGDDTVLSSVSIALLGDNLENATLTGTASLLTGNGLDNRITGNALANTLNGGAGNDTLAGGLGNDTLIGGLGDDTFVFDTADIGFHVIDGGGGNDTLLLAGASQTLNLTLVPNDRYQSIETIDLTGTGINTLVLNPADVVDLSDTTNRLLVDGNIGDLLTSINQQWTNTGTQSVGDVLYATFTHTNGAELWVDSDIGFTVT